LVHDTKTRNMTDIYISPPRKLKTWWVFGGEGLCVCMGPNYFFKR
jgi:hypothetical protein